MALPPDPERDAYQLADLMAEYAYNKKPVSDLEQRMITDATAWPKLIPHIPSRDAIPQLRAQAQKYHPLSPAIGSYMELIADSLEKRPNPHSN